MFCELVQVFRFVSGALLQHAANLSGPRILRLDRALSVDWCVAQHTEAGPYGAAHQVKRLVCQQQRSLVMASMSHSSVTVSGSVLRTSSVDSVVDA